MSFAVMAVIGFDVVFGGGRGRLWLLADRAVAGRAHIAGLTLRVNL